MKDKEHSRLERHLLIVRNFLPKLLEQAKKAVENEVKYQLLQERFRGSKWHEKVIAIIKILTA